MLIQAPGATPARCFERLNGVDLWPRRSCSHSNTQRNTREVHLRSGCDSALRDQFLQTVTGHIHHVDMHAAAELRTDCIGTKPLRRSPQRRDGHLMRLLECGTQFLIRVNKTTGTKDCDVLMDYRVASV